MISGLSPHAVSFVSKFKSVLSDPETKRSFYMQELDGASDGHAIAKKWLASKSVDPSEYKNALWNEENVAAERLQMALVGWQMNRQTSLSSEARAIERCAVVDALMEDEAP
jgi:hypothetical protein